MINLKYCKVILPFLLVLIFTACSSNFDIPPPPPSPVLIRIQGDNNIVSSMPLNNKTVSKVVATHIADGRAALRCTLTNKGSKALYTITSTNINKQLKVYWQDEVISNATIESPLGGSTMTLVIRLPNNTPSEIQGMIESIHSD